MANDIDWVDICSKNTYAGDTFADGLDHFLDAPLKLLFFIKGLRKFENLLTQLITRNRVRNRTDEELCFLIFLHVESAIIKFNVERSTKRVFVKRQETQCTN
jgi:hypothetical protein